MKVLVFLAGLLIVAVSSAYFMFPSLVEELQKWVDNKRHLYWVAGVRMVWGLILVLGADSTAYPVAIWWLGMIAVGAAVILTFCPPHTIRKILSWALNRPVYIIRLWVLLAVALGAFILHSVMV